MPLAFLFPGQASQYVGMGQDLYAASEAARDVFDLADEILGIGLKLLCFSGPEAALKRTSVTQPAVFTHSLAVLGMLEGKGIRPDIVSGHSVGEIGALVAAGVISLEDGLRVVGIRGKAMQAAGEGRPGKMAAVFGLSEKKIGELCESVCDAGVVSPANYNCPGQVVLSGDRAGIDRILEEAPARGAKRCIELPVGGAFHSALMEPAVEPLSSILETIAFSPARVPVIPNVTAEPTQDPDHLKRLLLEQVVSPVKWTDSIKRLISEGIDRAIEVGPGSVLQGLMRRIDRKLSVSGAGTLKEIEEVAG